VRTERTIYYAISVKHLSRENAFKLSDMLSGRGRDTEKARTNHTNILKSVIMILDGKESLANRSIDPPICSRFPDFFPRFCPTFYISRFFLPSLSPSSSSPLLSLALLLLPRR